LTVHVLIPVFNRLAMTRAVIDQLRSQALDEPLSITVVDDGSTDGTAEFLRDQQDVRTLKGNGHLWWGGAIDLGLRHILSRASPDDWVVFVNNDVEIRSNFLQALLETARQHAPAAVGSVIRHIDSPHRLLSVAPRIDARRFSVEDIVDIPDPLGDNLEVDALSGRGVLYPVAALRTAGGMRPIWLPHYLGDYELSLRVRACGWRLLVSTEAAVYSAEEWGGTSATSGGLGRFVSVRSPAYLPALVAFWWEASGSAGRWTLPLRLVLRALRGRRA
jgi:GT2 family glycosyltransferase